MADKILRGIDEDVWNEFAASAKAMRMKVGELLTLILKEHNRKRPETKHDGKSKILDIAKSIKEHNEIMRISEKLTFAVVRNAIEDWNGFEKKYSDGDLSIKYVGEWKKISTFGVNTIFDKLNEEERKYFVVLLLEETKNVFSTALLGKEEVSKFTL